MGVPARQRPPEHRDDEFVLSQVIDPAAGRIDPRKLAELLDWSNTELAGFLGVHKSVLSSNPLSRDLQPQLGYLAEVFRRILRLTGDLARARVWVNATPIRALERKTPKVVIFEGELRAVDSLLEQIEGGATL